MILSAAIFAEVYKIEWNGLFGDPFFANIVLVMNRLPDKRFYKVMSLFIKTMILILSFCYIAYKLYQTGRSAYFSSIIEASSSHYVLLAFMLMFLNWGLEALKWQILASPLEKISYRNAVLSVISGVTVSIFTPNRIGEFAGRIFYLQKADKLQATIASMFGSFVQLMVTIIAGLLAYYILQNNYYNFFGEGFISDRYLMLLALVLLLFTGTLYFMYRKRNTLFVKLRRYLQVIGMYPNKTLSSIFWLSVLRYAVFSFQYFLVLQAFNITAGTTILFCLIALTFFVTSAIPTFALTEIAVRGAAASFFFGTISDSAQEIVAASLLLWIINLVVPAVAGSIGVWKLRLFKS
jgi:uncharacterized membrane protein YbhN (UPF0104 family)